MAQNICVAQPVFLWQFHLPAEASFAGAKTDFCLNNIGEGWAKWQTVLGLDLTHGLPVAYPGYMSHSQLVCQSALIYHKSC